MPQKRPSTRRLARGSRAPFGVAQGLGPAPPLHHVLAAQQFDPATLDYLFRLADRMEKVAARGGNNQCRDRIMATLFYEPSTRTRFSFETAMLRLGGRVISTENAREFSSVSKGETLEDTIRILNGYADVIVLRHNEVGAAERAAAVSRVPIINAGDGVGQHPTQALLDLFTIRKELGRLEDLSVAMVGDLAQGRTVRSLAYLLSKFRDIRIWFVAPPELRMKEDILEHLRKHGVAYKEESDLAKVLPEADVVYQTRIQKERFGGRIADYEKVQGIYVLDSASLKLMKPKSIVMHPLPRVGEIRPEADADPRAAYFRQAQNGLYVRMALLATVLPTRRPRPKPGAGRVELSIP
ncbi:MAG: aspartate carbamoyltransferase [Acidobacteria bacterium]|nr:MAG: aspartate carbamoyltransferase [Acidobacteriota bacterium]